MKEESNDNLSPQLTEIPNRFHQDGEGRPFDQCTFCEQNLAEVGPYLIEKSMKVNRDTGRHYTVYEYAICGSCSRKKMEAMSKESVANIQRYMSENLNLDNFLSSAKTFEDKIGRCPITGQAINDLEEYNLVGQFVGDQMILGQFPMAVDAAVGEGMQDLLSEQTKKEFDDFMDTVNGIPPELRSLFKTKRPIFA